MSEIKTLNIPIAELKASDKCCLTCWKGYNFAEGAYMSCGISDRFVQYNNTCDEWMECEGEFEDYRFWDNSKFVRIETANN